MFGRDRGRTGWRATAMTLAFGAVLLGDAAPAPADFVGHGGMVRDVAIAADGSRIATAGFDYSVRVWDFLEQREHAALADHAGPVNAVALPGDGRTVISAGDDGVVRVWDTTFGDVRLRLAGHAGKVVALALAPDGTAVASAGWDGTVRLWSLTDGSERRRFDHDTAINAVVFIDSGTRLAVGDRDGRITLWQADTGERLDAFQAHPMGITALAWDGGRLLSAGIDGAVRLWPADRRTDPETFEGHDGPVFDATFAPDGRIVSAGRDGQIGVWSSQADHPVRWIDAHTGPVWSVAVTADGRFAVSAGSDGTVRVWHLQSGSRIGAPPEGQVEGEADRPEPWLTSPHPGARLYRACAICHALTRDELRRSGPHFAGLFGRRAGAVAGYHYSDSLRHADIVWSEATLRALFEEGPDEFLPGTKMPLQRIADPEALGHLIDYLRLLTAAGQDGDVRPERKETP